MAAETSATTLEAMRTALAKCAGLAAKRVELQLNDKENAIEFPDLVQEEMLCFSAALFPKVHDEAMACANKYFHDGANTAIARSALEADEKCKTAVSELPVLYHKFWHRLYNTTTTCDMRAHTRAKEYDEEKTRRRSMNEEEMNAQGENVEKKNPFIIDSEDAVIAEEIEVERKACCIETACQDNLISWQRCRIESDGDMNKKRCRDEWEGLRHCWLQFLMARTAVTGKTQEVLETSLDRLPFDSIDD